MLARLIRRHYSKIGLEYPTNLGAEKTLLFVYVFSVLYPHNFYCDKFVIDKILDSKVTNTHTIIVPPLEFLASVGSRIV